MAVHAVGMFCEDIREEKSGQRSIIGSFPDNINVNAPPETSDDTRQVGFIPKLGLYVRVVMGTDEDIDGIKIKLVMPDNTELPLGEIGKDLIETAKREAQESRIPIAGLIHTVVMGGFQVAKPGLVRAVAEFNDEAHVCAVLNIRQR